MPATNERRRWLATLLLVVIATFACTDGGESRQLPPSDSTPTCIRADETPNPSFTMPRVTPVPYPTPRGGRVDPEVDVPLFPGATEIDGFESHDLAVQAFEARATEAELFAFYEEELRDRGFTLRGTSGSSGSGRSCTFVHRDASDQTPRPIVIVSTSWVDRDGERTSPPPGFQGVGARFLPPGDGIIWFWVSTGG